MSQIGRNSPCPCGSGRKHKLCCLPRPSVAVGFGNPLFRATAGARAGASRPSYLDGDGRYVGQPFVQSEFKGQRLRAVGSRIYFGPITETFDEFLVRMLLSELGADWLNAESGKAPASQHVLAQWFREYHDLCRIAKRHLDGDREYFHATGNFQALRALAYDIYSIRHCSAMPENILDRLRNRNEFQGARYELAVAGLFVRIGCEIEWTQHCQAKRPEFTARHRELGVRVAVEAKSRQRAGALHRLGETIQQVRPKMERLLNQALEQAPNGLPFIIFLDVNLPMNNAVQTLEQHWVEELRTILEKRGDSSPDQPDPFTALFVTNFSWHYEGCNESSSAAEVFYVVPFFCNQRLRNYRLIEILFAAAHQYGSVPEGSGE